MVSKVGDTSGDQAQASDRNNPDRNNSNEYKLIKKTCGPLWL
jgi:hypothetical protein